jgi:hypothetical protein
MSNKKLAVLGIIAAFMLLWAVIQAGLSNKPRVSSVTRSYLIQGLDAGEINSIVLSAKKDKVIIKRQGKGFGIVEKNNYPADVNQIKDLIANCLDIKTSEFVTNKPVNHDSLEVTEDKASIIVKFLKEDSNVITGIIAGKTRQQGQGTYVRRVSSDEVYLADNMHFISADAMSYINQQLLSVKRENIELVTVTDPNGQSYSLKPGADDSKSVVLEPVPAGRKAKSDICDTIFTALTNLRFEDVAKNFGDLTFNRQYVCKLKDTTVYTLKIAKKDGNTYLSCAAVFGDTTSVKPAEPNESQEETAKKNAKLLAWEHANIFINTHKGWIYKIPEYLAGRLTKELSELIVDEKMTGDTGKIEDIEKLIEN